MIILLLVFNKKKNEMKLNAKHVLNIEHVPETCAKILISAFFWFFFI